MNSFIKNFSPLLLTSGLTLAFAGMADAQSPAAKPSNPDAPKIPGFSIEYMDPTVKPGEDFYHFADGGWIRKNPVPADKSRWGSFNELGELNWFLIHEILEKAAVDESKPLISPIHEVGDLYTSAMDTRTIEKLGLSPITNDLNQISLLESKKEMFALLGDFHNRGIGGFFEMDFSPDAKNSSIYVVNMGQGGLSLPDRDYYLKDSFAEVRTKYRQHLEKMFSLTGDTLPDAAAHADIVLKIETALAQAGRSRVELRDPDKNYNKITTRELLSTNLDLRWKTYFESRKIELPEYEIVGQPEFFRSLNQLIAESTLTDLKVYLRWHLLSGCAPLLQDAIQTENFEFFGKVLSGQPQQEPRWKRAALLIDGTIGEALGKLYMDKYFPPRAKERMNDLVENIKSVFHDRLEHVSWMTDTTRAKALEKFQRFTQKIGGPDTFRDYTSVVIKRDDLIGNVWRAHQFQTRRHIERIGKAVDRKEWHMTPETVNAYFNPEMNEIVFPAGILQPPFFDIKMDDAVNYGAIGVVIGHEITHGYDDHGRKFDADGNLHDWWTEADAKSFEDRAQLVVDEYNGFEALPGLHVNGKLTLGENLADLGGINIAYEALERALAKDPSLRKNIDGFTPEQRFFISFAQVWRTNVRDAESRRRVTTDPHSPGQFRSFGPLLNVQEFYDAFGIKPGDPLYLDPAKRAKIW